MMYTVPDFYHGSQNAYGVSNAPVKLEPVDSMDTHGPVDMTQSSHEPQPNTSLQIPLDLAHCEIMSLYGRCPTRRLEHHNAQKAVIEHIANIQHTSTVDNHISTTSSDMKDYPENGSDRKGVPVIITKSDMLFTSESVEQRARREFVPDSKKDESYWCKRLKNNDAARRSRVKRKALEKIMETRLIELENENIELKHQVAALRRRYGEEDGSTSDSSSSRDHTSSNSTSLPPSSPVVIQTEDDEQFCVSGPLNSSIGSQVYGIDSTDSVNQSLVTLAKDRQDSISNISNSQNCSRVPLTSQPCSYMSRQSSTESGLQMDVTGALDLTTDHSNRSTPAWQSSSFDSVSSDGGCSLRRYSFINSDSSSQDDNTNIRSMKVFPLKCRWKKEMHATYMTVA